MYNILLILGGLALLIYGGNWLLKSAVSISLMLNIPKVVIGMTIVSFATSAPELIVSIESALSGHADISLGNVIGSNIANIGLVLGVTILLGTIEVKKIFFRLDWPVMMFSSLLLYVFIAFDGILLRYEGIIFVVLLMIFLIYLLKTQKGTDEIDEISESDDHLTTKMTLFFLAIGGIALWGGSQLLISGAVGTAQFFGVSERVISVSIIAVGTSIPELSASVIAIMKKEKAISLGNLIGSNIFNVFAVLGITSIISPIKVGDQRLINTDIYWMLGFALSIVLLILLPNKMKLGKKEGILLLGCYIFYIYTTISS